MATYIIGDLHGHFDQYVRMLQETNLCDQELNWCGGSDSLWLIGDFFDRGKSGIDCLELTMKLQAEAPETDGSVDALLGNHEMMILCARQFGDTTTDFGVSVSELWKKWGGVAEDMVRLNDNHAAFIHALPAMALVDNNLLIHADAMVYVNYGTTIDAVNKSFREVMQDTDLKRWLVMLDAFAEHMAFSGLQLTGIQRVEQILRLYGGKRLIHGHTPIPYARASEPQAVDRAWEYADGLCVNVDGGIYMGGPGFVYQLN